MKIGLLAILRCPYCGRTLSASAAHPVDTAEIEYGILACACNEFPVVGGIPIFQGEGRVNVMRQTVDSVIEMGPPVKDLVKLVKAGSYEKALLRLLVIPKRNISRLFALSGCVPTRAGGGKIRSLADLLWSRQQDQNREFVLDRREGATAMEMIRFFYHTSLQLEVYHYFSCRFGQPRHLAALSLASLLPTGPGPILDLACGFGHLVHYWRHAHPRQTVVGLDRNFFQLYVARKYVAPGAEFVCSEADGRLPFSSEVFSGVFCSDAFHCFLRRLQCVEEMKRVTHDEDGLLLLARFGNREVEPREGYELTGEEYKAMFTGLTTRLVSEEHLLHDYLKGLGPQLGDPLPPSQMVGQKWLSLAASKQPGTLRNSGKLGEWPHGVGRLKLNPLYQVVNVSASGNQHLKLKFPSAWYEFENRGCLRYMPESVELSRSAADALQNGQRTDEISRLLKSCVVIGVPERYV
jgi:ubiquinone/menaquinone biosynthesis C-methylase UbiE